MVEARQFLDHEERSEEQKEASADLLVDNRAADESEDGAGDNLPSSFYS